MSSIQETTASSPVSIIIIGGGLSGIAIAHKLVAIQKPSIKNHNLSTRWHLLDSQNYIMGRIKSDNITKQIDMGGTWIWPSQQNIQKWFVIRNWLQFANAKRMMDVLAFKAGRHLLAGLNDHCITLSITVVECVKVDNAAKVTFVTGLSNIPDSTMPPQQHIVYNQRIVSCVRFPHECHCQHILNGIILCLRLKWWRRNKRTLGWHLSPKLSLCITKSLEMARGW